LIFSNISRAGIAANLVETTRIAEEMGLCSITPAIGFDKLDAK